MNGLTGPYAGQRKAFSAGAVANPVNPAIAALPFTIAPHLQTINYRNRFSRFPGI